jgi:hypothetical protein
MAKDYGSHNALGNSANTRTFNDNRALQKTTRTN